MNDIELSQFHKIVPHTVCKVGGYSTLKNPYPHIPVVSIPPPPKIGSILASYTGVNIYIPAPFEIHTPCMEG